MKCEKCDRDWTHFGAKNDLPCPYCGHVNNKSPVADISIVNADDTVDMPVVEACEAKELYARDMASQVSLVRPRERRAVCVRVGAHSILDMMGFGLRPRPGYVLVPEFPQLPAGCTVHGPWADPMSRTVNFIVEHPSFAVVPDGTPAPDWPGVLECRFRAVRIEPDKDE